MNTIALESFISSCDDMIIEEGFFDIFTNTSKSNRDMNNIVSEYIDSNKELIPTIKKTLTNEFTKLSKTSKYKKLLDSVTTKIDIMDWRNNDAYPCIYLDLESVSQQDYFDNDDYEKFLQQVSKNVKSALTKVLSSDQMSKISIDVGDDISALFIYIKPVLK